MNLERINYKLIGQRIKKYRISKNITQGKFAECLDVTVGYISQIERGISKVNLERLAAIAEFFGCSIIDLLVDASTSDPTYLQSEIFTLYEQLNLSEKATLVSLLKAYLEHKSFH